jgi:translation initiation factor eIF-2B subunit alpha/methylthioribose-1-phosphate isomerase
MGEVRALWFEDGALVVIDQRLLPLEKKLLSLRTIDQVAEAIRTLTVRGAPAIGVAAAYGMVVAERNDKIGPERASEILRGTRPTAHDLFVGVDHVLKAWMDGKDTLEAANEFKDKVVGECKAIGEHGAPLIRKNARVLTHCNAGALATVEWGTSLAPIRVAYREGRNPFVWVDETRPLLQGSRLTAWELKEEGISHAVIADNAAGHFMHNREVDLVIVGADRITRSGDFANKIGTYEKAVLAKENEIPFFVAAPWSTFDAKLLSGTDIPIEERNGDEVLFFASQRTAPLESKARNPAFDVTPSNYVTGFITPGGVFSPGKVSEVIDKFLK